MTTVKRVPSFSRIAEGNSCASIAAATAVGTSARTLEAGIFERYSSFLVLSIWALTAEGNGLAKQWLVGLGVTHRVGLEAGGITSAGSWSSPGTDGSVSSKAWHLVRVTVNEWRSRHHCPLLDALRRPGADPVSLGGVESASVAHSDTTHVRRS
jgi:hypothetical protein